MAQVKIVKKLTILQEQRVVFMICFFWKIRHFFYFIVEIFMYAVVLYVLAIINFDENEKKVKNKIVR